MSTRTPRTEHQGAPPERLPDPAAVRAFLEANPDFLAEHPQLFEKLVPPAAHAEANVHDLRQFMLRRLQGEVDRLKTDRRTLIAAARANQATQARVHRAVLQILEATTFEHLIHIVTTDLAQVFDVDAVTLSVEAAEEPAPRRPRTQGVYVLEPGTVDDLLGADGEVLLLSATRGGTVVFGPAVHLVQSQALVRMRASSRTPDGLLALGSREPDQFQPGQGTELLQFFARTLARQIRGWLNLPA